jgi:glutathione peroxidase
MTMGGIYDFTARDMTGDVVRLSEYRGKVLLIVNTASKCGFTPQYEGLEKLYRSLRPQGLMVLGFPCNQFGAQEPGSEEEIASFCEAKYDVSFPIFAKVDVNGPGASPLYTWLKREAPGLLSSQAIKWNFTKFLVDRTGEVAGRFPPTKTPQSMRGEIESLLETLSGSD